MKPKYCTDQTGVCEEDRCYCILNTEGANGTEPRPKNVLEQAADIIYNKREERSYGDFSDCMEKTAQMASLMIGKTIEPVDVYKIMIAMKMAREENSHKDDNLIDAIGYIAGLYDYHKEGKVEEPMEEEQNGIGVDSACSVLNVCVCQECCKDRIPFEKLEGMRVLLHYVALGGDIVAFSSKDLRRMEQRKEINIIDFLDKTIAYSKEEKMAPDVINGLQYARGEIRRRFLGDPTI